MFRIKFPTKKSVGACLPSSRVELRVFKDWYISNIILYWNVKVDSVWGSTLPKIRIIWEKVSNKGYRALNSLQTVTAPLQEGGGIDVCAHRIFCADFTARQILFEVLFLDITHIFGNVALSPKVNLLSHFWTSKNLKDNNLWSSLAPLLGEIDVCTRWLFYTEFDVQKF